MGYGETGAQWPCGASSGACHHYRLFHSWGVPAFSCLFCQVFDKPMGKNELLISCLMPTLHSSISLGSCNLRRAGAISCRSLIALTRPQGKLGSLKVINPCWCSGGFGSFSAASQQLSCLLTSPEKATESLLSLWAFRGARCWNPGESSSAWENTGSARGNTAQVIFERHAVRVLTALASHNMKRG